MGQDWRPNRAVSSGIMIELLKLTGARALAASTRAEMEKWIFAGCYFCFCYVVSLRSPEGLMVDLKGLMEYLDPSRDHVVIPLLGKVKGEDHVRSHLLHCVNVTGSGINVVQWIQRLITLHEIRGRSSGPAFFNFATQTQWTTTEMNVLFLEVLAEVYDAHRDMFAIDVKSVADLSEKYHVFRSFRRGSESQAVSKKVSEADRYVVNRWRRKEKAGASRVAHPIDQHYVDVSLVKASFLRYTKAM